MAIGNPHFDFTAMSAAQRQKTLVDYNIALKPEEALKVQDLLGRAPSLSECILWGIQGSEHCSYKSSRIHLKTLTTDGPNVILGAKEDAGVVAMAEDEAGRRWGIAISHESHNHPSQIVPFEGAATGIGGNVRDVCCMGATVIANADSLRFGDLSEHKTHWIYEGVVEGIASYGNALGVPNLTGDVQFDSQYNDNCLVTVVTLGAVCEDYITHSYAPENAMGYDLILVGKPTDNSGFGGASFASIDLEEDNKEANRGAVQEPNAFLGRMLLKANYALFKKIKARKAWSKVGFKDLGAGGIACASVELAQTGGYGAEVWLDDVHVSMAHLNPAVVLCSETQERYMWVCHPELTTTILAHYNEEYALPEVSEGACATIVGKIREDDRYHVTYRGETLIDARAKDITEGIVYERPYSEPVREFTPVQLPQIDIATTLPELLAHENIASTEVIGECYDKQVQGRSIIERGQADAGVMAPYNHHDFPQAIRDVGIALAVADNPRYGRIDPYWATVNAVIQAMQSVIAVGAMPQAITDCLCFGNPEKPEQMWELVEAVRGLKAACETLTLFEHSQAPTPIVAGNVSLYNESPNGAIPASPMISCLGKMVHIDQAITPQLKQSGSLLILVGARTEVLGGSVLHQLHGQLGGDLPQPNLQQLTRQHHAVMAAMQTGGVQAAKAIYYGGVAVALAQMTFGTRLGINADISGIDDAVPTQLFNEAPGFILAVPTIHLDQVSDCFDQYHVDSEVIGRVTDTPQLALNGTTWASADLYATWRDGLRQQV